MSSGISTERVFSLSCFEGLKLVREYAAKYPDHTSTELITLIEHVEADGASLDLEAAVYLGTIVDNGSELDGQIFYQSCIKAVILRHQPIWSKTMRHGRKRFIRTLDRGDQDIFAAAGLMDDPLSNDVVIWWDDVSGYARLIHDRGKMEQGRQAELLTLAHEKERLEGIGINQAPEWPGLDDNFAGYDVLSYDQGEHGVVNRMIEVKSTTASPLRFMLSRNEWSQAEKVGDSYIFHIWDMAKATPILHVRSVSDVSPHIPSDNGKGSWTVATIPLSAGFA